MAVLEDEEVGATRHGSIVHAAREREIGKGGTQGSGEIFQSVLCGEFSEHKHQNFGR